jgi:hypothetical protein
VQIFDVDPATETADLVEAAWPGMLVYRQDRSILQIYDGTAGAWADVAGGVAGQLTYVGPVEPTGGPFNVGDVWYDDSNGYAQYIWNGTAWVPSGGVHTFQNPGFFDLDGDPDTPPAYIEPVAIAVGDIWYQIDDGNRPRRWDGTNWVDAKDPNTQIVEAVAGNVTAIDALSQTVNELAMVATSADNTADTADGRVSMSDYNPGTDDILYDQVKDQIDPDTGAIVPVTVSVSRQNGSIWFTRTRPRANLCTNPSFEVSLVDWNGVAATISRVTDPHEIAGDWTMQVSNDASAADHYTRWNPVVGQPCVPGEIYTASAFAELVSGTGLGVHMALAWYDATNTLMTTTAGDPLDLVTNSWDPALAGTMAEPRMKVTGTVPAGAAFLRARAISPAANVNDVWRCSAVLVEQEDDLGRYFDGASYDGHWDGTAQVSTSYLSGDKIIAIWELRDQSWIQKYLTSETLFNLDASKLVGSLNAGILSPNTLNANALVATSVTASESLSAGDIVNVWNSSGTFRVRKACAYPGQQYEAHGFVLDAVSSGQSVSVHHVGYNSFRSGLAPGAQWVSTVAGQVTNTPPTSVGSMVQRIGFAPASGVLNFEPMAPIRII